MAFKTKPFTFLFASFFSISFFLVSQYCFSQNNNYNKNIALRWGKTSLQMMTKLPGNSPVYASRAMGYMGLAMYQSVVFQSKKHMSLAGQLNQLDTLPIPSKNEKINIEIVLNECTHLLANHLFEWGDTLKSDSLYYCILAEFKVKNTNSRIIQSSQKYGKSLGLAIIEYAKKDGGYKSYSLNFDGNYVFPKGAGHWVPPLFGQVITDFPLQPFWGQKKEFLTKNEQLPIPEILPLNKDTSSICYQQHRQLYLKNINLTQEEKNIAGWWSDDPTETFTPPGHSWSIANQMVELKAGDIFEATETYARVGIAVADAFVNCWKAKYKYHSERPSNYIQRHIDSNFKQYWPEPPFPAFYSGHAVQCAAAATVLMAQYGTFEFVDNSHSGRLDKEFRGVTYTPRKYKNFNEMAQESAYSRFLGGIHITHDNQIGLEVGNKVGQNVNDLNWYR